MLNELPPDRLPIRLHTHRFHASGGIAPYLSGLTQDLRTKTPSDDIAPGSSPAEAAQSAHVIRQRRHSSVAEQNFDQSWEQMVRNSKRANEILMTQDAEPHPCGTENHQKSSQLRRSAEEVRILRQIRGHRRCSHVPPHNLSPACPLLLGKLWFSVILH